MLDQKIFKLKKNVSIFFYRLDLCGKKNQVKKIWSEIFLGSKKFRKKKIWVQNYHRSIRFFQKKMLKKILWKKRDRVGLTQCEGCMKI